MDPYGFARDPAIPHMSRRYCVGEPYNVAMRDTEGLAHNAERSEGIADDMHALLHDAEAMGRLYRTAESCARLPRDSSVARELVWDVIGDVLLGDLICDRQRLPAQLTGAVRRRAKRLRRGAQRSAFVPLASAPMSAFLVDTELHDSPEDDEQGGPDAAELVTRIRQQTHDDAAVQQLLALYERGLVSRRDVLRAAGMKPWVYRAARQRLTVYAAMAIAGTSAMANEPQRRAS